MRYADGGGLTAEGRSRREQVRLQAAKMFAEDAGARQIAWSLRVSTKSVYQWRRASAWHQGSAGELGQLAGCPGVLPLGGGEVADRGRVGVCGPRPIRLCLSLGDKWVAGAACCADEIAGREFTDHDEWRQWP